KKVQRVASSEKALNSEFCTFDLPFTGGLSLLVGELSGDSPVLEGHAMKLEVKIKSSV
ncbi:hypothetical protein LINPERHAP1_LOCUS30027, partial [Linum perenne]